MKKVALYCRVSSEDQKERDTIENQIEILNTYVELREDLEIYDEYTDNGITGTISLENRPDGARLIQDASKGLFDTVIVWKVDRFGRDTLTGLQAAEIIIQYGVKILSVTEPFDLNTPTGRYQFINYLNMAELDRNNILDRLFIGATRAAKKGKWMGGIVPYGYFKNKEGYLEIDEEEAKVIKKIFDLYTKENVSCIDIAVYLNNAGIPTSCGSGKGGRTKGITKKWRAGSIQRILSNTTYMGIHEYGKRASRRKETIIREVPAIISEEDWNKAQEVKKRNMLQAKRCNNKREYLLRGLIKCAYCGRTYYGISYKGKNSVYSCSGKRGENKKVLGVKCDNVNISAPIIEEAVWKDCKYIIENYDECVKHLKLTNKKQPIDSIEDDIKKLKKSLDEKIIEKDRILTLFRKGHIPEEDTVKQLDDIKKEQDKIINLLSSIETKKGYYEHEDMLINSMQSKLKYYHDKIESLTFDEKYDLVKLLVKEIKVETVIENGTKAPHAHIIYNLVKLDSFKDMDTYSKFDIYKEKIPTYIYIDSPGTKIRNLRLINNISLEGLAKEIGSNPTTLMHLEQGKVKKPYHYWKMICDYFNINHIEYLGLLNLPEETIQDKLLKIRILLGAKNWSTVGECLGYSEGFVLDLLNRYTPNKAHINTIDTALNKLQRNIQNE